MPAVLLNGLVQIIIGTRHAVVTQQLAACVSGKLFKIDSSHRACAVRPVQIVDIDTARDNAESLHDKRQLAKQRNHASSTVFKLAVLRSWTPLEWLKTIEDEKSGLLFNETCKALTFVPRVSLFRIRIAEKAERGIHEWVGGRGILSSALRVEGPGEHAARPAKPLIFNLSKPVMD